MGSCYPHLAFEERRKIAKWRETKIPELNGYHALVAQEIYEERRAIHRKLIRHPDIKAAVEDALKTGWSPEQIAGRMRLERHPIRVSHETIYSFAYSKEGRAEHFHRHLPEHRRGRRPRSQRRHQRGHIFDTQCLRNEDRQSKPIMEAPNGGLSKLPAD